MNTISITEKKPIKEFDLNQTMYSSLTVEGKDDLTLKATEFIGNDMSYNDLIISAGKLAQAFHNFEIKNGNNIAILTKGSTNRWNVVNIKKASKELVLSEQEKLEQEKTLLLKLKA